MFFYKLQAILEGVRKEEGKEMVYFEGELLDSFGGSNQIRVSERQVIGKLFFDPERKVVCIKTKKGETLKVREMVSDKSKKNHPLKGIFGLIKQLIKPFS